MRAEKPAAISIQTTMGVRMLGTTHDGDQERLRLHVAGHNSKRHKGSLLIYRWQIRELAKLDVSLCSTKLSKSFGVIFAICKRGLS